MRHHESSEEDVDRLHDRDWDHLRTSVVPVEVQGRENRQEDRVKECTVVRDWSRSKPLKDCGAELESDLLHPDIWLHQVADDLLDVAKLLRGSIWVLADESRQECAKSWDQVLHTLAPVSLE